MILRFRRGQQDIKLSSKFRLCTNLPGKFYSGTKGTSPYFPGRLPERGRRMPMSAANRINHERTRVTSCLGLMRRLRHSILRRLIFGCDQTPPAGVVVAGNRFVDRRQVGRPVNALRMADTQNFEPPGAHMRHGIQQPGNRHAVIVPLWDYSMPMRIIALSTIRTVLCTFASSARRR